MQIKTERLIIREIMLKDIKDYYNYASNPKIARLAGFKPVEDENIAQILITGFIYRGNTYVILDKANNFMGTITLEDKGIRKIKDIYTIGISLKEEYWGYGYATESIREMLNYIFKYKRARYVEIMHEPNNIRSKNMILKCGFKYIGLIEDYGYLYDKTIYDICLYSISEKEFLENEENIRNKI